MSGVRAGEPAAFSSDTNRAIPSPALLPYGQQGPTPADGPQRNYQPTGRSSISFRRSLYSINLKMPLPVAALCVKKHPGKIRRFFPGCKIKNKISAEDGQSACGGHLSAEGSGSDPSCLRAELAPAVILPIQAVFLRKLQAAQVAVVLFEVRGQMPYAEFCFQLLPDGVDALGVLVGADGQRGGEPV